MVDRNGRSEAELVRRIPIARDCMTSLDRNIWRSSNSVSTKIRSLSEIIRSRRLNWFGHVARASQELDHRRALYAAVHGQPLDWKRRRGKPAHTWTRTVEADLKPANIGLFSAWHRAQHWTSGVVSFGQPCPRVGFAPDYDDTAYPRL